MTQDGGGGTSSSTNSSPRMSVRDAQTDTSEFGKSPMISFGWVDQARMSHPEEIGAGSHEAGEDADFDF